MYVRLYNPGRECIFGDSTGVLPNYLETYYGTTNQKPRFIEVKWIGTTQVAAEELGTAANAVKDGTTTPFQITVVSSQANDLDAATGDARKVAIIGVSVSSIAAYGAGEKATLGVEVVNLNGVSDVLTSRWYLKVIHAYCCDWGSTGGDAVGNITIESPANTTLLTIAAGYNESNGGTLYFAEGDSVLVDTIRILPTVTLAAGDGTTVQTTEAGFENAYNDESDFAVDYYTYMHYGAPGEIVRDAWLAYRLATKAASLLLAEIYIAHGIASKIQIGIKVGKTIRQGRI